ncbi:MAG: PAS domain S-box protein [Terracidiphilus sp.]|jgi:PAS domain S-box-containing protein
MNEILETAPATAAPAFLLDIDDLPLPYLEMNARGIITRANRATLALHHPEQGVLIGKSGWDLMALDEKDLSYATFLSHMASGEELPVISRSLFDRSGAFRVYEIHASLIRDAEGKPAGMRVLCVDVTGARKALEDARRDCQWLESTIQSLPEACILMDALGTIRSMNRAAEELSGWCARDLKGMAMEELLPVQAFPPGGSKLLDYRAMLEGACRGTAGLLTRGRKELRVEISTSPIVNRESGSVSGVAVLLRKTGGAG